MATPSLILVPCKYKVGTLYTEVATTSSGTVLGSLGDFNVTRASIATRVNNQGFIETIPAVTNLIVQSQNWLASGWRSDATGNVTTVTGTTGTVDPLGTNTANAISPTSGSATHLKVGSENSASFTSGTVYTSSAFFKQGTGNAGRYVQLTYPASRFSQNGFANFDLQAGAVVASGGTADTNRAARIENYGNGWYRCSFTATCTSNGTENGFTSVLITASGSTRAPSFAGTITDVLYGWGAQTEASSSASPYVATTTAAVTNSIPRIDYYTSSGTVGCPALLVEPSGTNFARGVELLNTPTPVTDSGGITVTTGSTDFIAPNGSSGTITKYVGGTASGSNFLEYISSTSVTASGVHTFSAFVKAGTTNPLNFCALQFTAFTAASGTGTSYFSLASGTALTSGASIQDYGNGWYRIISAPYTIASGDLSGSIRLLFAEANNDASFPASGALNLTLYAWGIQLEAGSVATSYIPTTTTSATRNADVINVSGAVSGCIGQTEGTMYAEVDLRALSVARSIFGVSINSNTTDFANIQVNSSNRIFARMRSNTGTVQDVTATSTVTGTIKIAMAYDSSGSILVVNGTIIGTNASGIPSWASGVNFVHIGNGPSAATGSSQGGFFNDRIRAFALYTTRLTNEELELLTYPIYYSNVRDLIWGTFVARNSTFSELQSCLQTRHNQLISV